MKLLLGHGTEARLLVDTDCKELSDKFAFWVINGQWRGSFDNGTIKTLEPWVFYDEITDTDIQILCSDQELLSGGYDDVISNYNNRMAENGLKTYEEFATVYTKRRTTVNVDSLVSFFDVHRPDGNTVKDLIRYLTDIEMEYPDKELLVSGGYDDVIMVEYIQEESDEDFDARIRKSYNAYVARQHEKKIKKAETREDKIKALEAEIERLKTIGE